jgi:hypothetical protein
VTNLKKRDETVTHMQSKESSVNLRPLSIYSRILQTASAIMSVATTDLEELFRNQPVAKPDVDSSYQSTRLNHLKGNWNIIVPNQAKPVKAK